MRSTESSVKELGEHLPGASFGDAVNSQKVMSPLMDDKTCSKIRQIKKSVLQMLEERSPGDTSNMWSFACEKFQYMLGLEEKYYAQLRIHTYHLDTDSYIRYKSDTFYRQADEMQWRRIVSKLPKSYVEGDPRCAGEYGHEIDESLVNKNTIRYYAIIKILHEKGIIPALRSSDAPLVLEIGAGYGGLAYHLSKIVPKAKYVIVDLPETLLFAASYLTIACPERSLYLYDSKNIRAACSTDFAGYDFVLLPTYALRYLNNLRFHLALNVGSFQEMNCEQLDTYLDFLKPRLSGVLYSQNQDSHIRNTSPINVTQALGKRFATEEVRGVKAFSPAAILLSDPSRLLDVTPRTLLSYLHKKLGPQKRHTINHEYICRPLS